MQERFRKAFFAYPCAPSDLGGTIESVSNAINDSPVKLKIKTWCQTNVFGAHIPGEIRTKILEVDILIADITKPNYNVYYEIGFAIGSGKSIAPVVNTSFNGVTEEIRRDGIFDNIGYKTYDNSEQLTAALLDLPNSSLVELYAKPLNHQQPLYVLDTFRKTDFRNAIISAVKGSKVFYRSFDPAEIARFQTVSIIGEVTASAGIIVPVLDQQIEDADRHNLRGAFLAGLAHGLERQTLLIQRKQDSTNPADYREFITSVRNQDDIEEYVSEFAQQSMVASQSIRAPIERVAKSDLQKLTLGSPAAENEFRTLQEYFVETAEYVRTMRGEVQIVAGRKGSGKTAIFFRVRDSFRTDKGHIVVDLKPESHQLSLFREELLKIVGVGTFDHTLAAFWYFVITSEILLTIRRQAEYRSKYDGESYEIAREIEATLERFNILESGDFTSRLNRLGSFIIQEIQRLKNQQENITAERLTNVVFRDAISELRSLISKHTSDKSSFVFLFDNIDKGWPANGVDTLDIRLVRLLIEGLDKVRRDFNAQHRDFMSVVFLRNDIYELLVEETPDRGKVAQIRIDWTDRSKLRQVIYKRLQSSSSRSNLGFEQLWTLYFTPMVGNTNSFEYFIDHCLMRPRFLINIIENAIANAINRAHTLVTEEDCIDAVRQHSSYLIDDFGYEIRDVSGLSAEILYALIGVTSLLTKEEVIDCFKNFGLNDQSLDEAFKLMLWYGVIGVANNDNRGQFIYDFDYRMKRLDAEVRTLGEDALFVVNPAFHVGLK